MTELYSHQTVQEGSSLPKKDSCQEMLIRASDIEERVLSSEQLPDHARPIVEGFMQLCLLALIAKSETPQETWQGILTEAAALVNDSTAVEGPLTRVTQVATGLMNPTSGLSRLRRRLMEIVEAHPETSKAYGLLRLG
jgi:hypothetical protein